MNFRQARPQHHLHIVTTSDALSFFKSGSPVLPMTAAEKLKWRVQFTVELSSIRLTLMWAPFQNMNFVAAGKKMYKTAYLAWSYDVMLEYQSGQFFSIYFAPLFYSLFITYFLHVALVLLLFPVFLGFTTILSVL